MSSLGLADERYLGISEPAVKEDKKHVTNRLEALIEVVAQEVRDLCRRAAERGKALPEAGFELTSAEGEIVATAELAWTACRIAVLLEHEDDGEGRFEAAGWRVFRADSVVNAPEPLLDLLPDEVAE